MANWNKISSRGNVEDRRGNMALKGVGSISIAGILVFAAIGYIAGKDPGQILIETITEVQNSNQSEYTEPSGGEFEGKDSYELFASTVLGSNNELWEKIFSSYSMNYSAPKLVLFREYTNSSCGGADSSYGPHYCGVDNTIYLDETFFEELTKNYGANGGDVAEAYVIAHEVAHHVQNELGTMKKVNDIRSSTPELVNNASIKLELQADCYAGIWASSIAGEGILEKNEISEAIDAAESVGDDRIQKTATGRINPESWTHGSSKDRKKWFTIGYEKGDLELCNTF